jgi:hypothetical protein
VTVDGKPLAKQLAHDGRAVVRRAGHIVSSVCPIHPSFQNGDANDPLLGYRPAVRALVDRLKDALRVP